MFSQDNAVVSSTVEWDNRQMSDSVDTFSREDVEHKVTYDTVQ